MDDIKKRIAVKTRTANTSLLRSSWNSRRKSFCNFGNIIMNGEFPSEISAATDSTLAYICIRINIYKNAFSFKLLEEAVIFKSLKYTVPSLARSFVHSLARFYCTHWKHLSLQERKVSTTLFRRSKRWAFDHVSSDSLGKWRREANERGKRILLL